MEHVRLSLMILEYLVQCVEEEPLIKSNSECKDFLIEAMKYHLLKGQQSYVQNTEDKSEESYWVAKSRY